MPKRTVLLLGATGLVGGYLLDGLLNAEFCGRVVTLTRSVIKNAGVSAKLDARLVDFERPEKWRDQVAADLVICAMGTTMKKAGSREAFRRVDFDYPLTVAQAARRQGCRHFLLVSAMGANPGARLFYNRVKGELEAAILTLEFDSVSIFRPSLLLGNRPEFRLGEALGQMLGRRISCLIPKRYRPIHASAVAKAMLRIAKQDSAGNRILTSADIAGLARV
jgi:uncharacterized protein YbjT (DUF2867 family)